MRAILCAFCLAVPGWLLAGDVQWGGSSSFDENKEYKDFNKNLEFKSLNPDEFGSDKGGANFFNKSFSTKDLDLFDKEYNSGKKDIIPKDLDFNKDYPTKDLDFTSKESSFSEHPLTFKTDKTPWEGRKSLVGFNKQVEAKEYTGPFAPTMRKTIVEVNKGLNSNHELPDHDLTIDEVKELLNKGHAPGANFSEATQPTVAPSPQVSPKPLLQ